MANPVRKRAIAGLTPGDTFTFARQFTREETEAFGDLTRDYNPVHYDERWTDRKGFHGLVCHGLLFGSMICEFGGQVGWLATGMNFTFCRPVFFDDTVQCRVTLTRLEATGRAEAEAVFTNQHGKQVALAGLTGRLPLEAERQILGQMVDEGDPTNRLADKTDYQIG